MDSRKKFMTQKEVAACVDVAEYTVREQFGEVFRPRIEAILNAMLAPAKPSHQSSSSQTFHQRPAQIALTR